MMPRLRCGLTAIELLAAIVSVGLMLTMFVSGCGLARESCPAVTVSDQSAQSLRVLQGV